MTQEQKSKIKEELIKQFGISSQNKLAKKWNISSAMLTHVAKDNWSVVGLKTWKKLADVLGLNKEEWQIVETRQSKFISELLDIAQFKSNVFALIAPAGSGKTATTKQYAHNVSSVYRIECAEYWNKKAFMSELLKSMGHSPEGKTIYHIMENIQEAILKEERPLLILDEADKLRDEVFYFFITLYNKLQGKCGIVICATNYLQNRIVKGLKNNKKGYQEIFSRIGRRFVEVPSVGSIDISNICTANGVTATKDIEHVIKEAEGDIRRVERSIESIKLRNENSLAA